MIRAHEERVPAPRGRARGRPNPAIEILGNLDAERLSIVSFVVRRAERPLPAPQLRRRAAQRPVRHPVARRLLVRRPVRPPAARHRPRALARVRARDRRAAARASSPAGCGSTSTTSSPRRSSTTSSRPSTWSPATAGGCCRDYRFDPATGLWRHRDGPVEPPLRLTQLTYDADGELTLPAPRRHARRSPRWPATSTRRAPCSPTRSAADSDGAAPGDVSRRLRAPALVRPPAGVPARPPLARGNGECRASGLERGPIIRLAVLLVLLVPLLTVVPQPGHGNPGRQVGGLPRLQPPAVERTRTARQPGHRRHRHGRPAGVRALDRGGYGTSKSCWWLAAGRTSRRWCRPRCAARSRASLLTGRFSHQTRGLVELAAHRRLVGLPRARERGPHPRRRSSAGGLPDRPDRQVLQLLRELGAGRVPPTRLG